jgi:tetratricopeptide repeat protein
MCTPVTVSWLPVPFGALPSLMARYLPKLNRSRRALAIDDRSLGTNHPSVAVSLNKLAKLLRATNHLTEAEPLSKRAVTIFDDFRRRTGHEQPNARTVEVDYSSILRALCRSRTDIDAVATKLKPE